MGHPAGEGPSEASIRNGRSAVDERGRESHELRLGHVAGVITFLASDDAAFVTGASLLADGGRKIVM